MSEKLTLQIYSVKSNLLCQSRLLRCHFHFQICPSHKVNLFCHLPSKMSEKLTLQIYSVEVDFYSVRVYLLCRSWLLLCQSKFAESIFQEIQNSKDRVNWLCGRGIFPLQCEMMRTKLRDQVEVQHEGPTWGTMLKPQETSSWETNQMRTKLRDQVEVQHEVPTWGTNLRDQIEGPC